MNAFALSSRLNHVFAIFVLADGKTFHTLDCKQEFESQFQKGSALSAISCEVSAWASLQPINNDNVYPISEKERVIASFARKGAIWYEDLIQSQLDGEEFDDCANDYGDLCERLAIALDINTDDDKVNPEYFTTAQRDCLTPIRAVTELQEE